MTPQEEAALSHHQLRRQMADILDRVDDLSSAQNVVDILQSAGFSQATISAHIEGALEIEYDRRYMRSHIRRMEAAQ